MRRMLFLFAIFLLLAPLPAQAAPLPAHRSLLFADDYEEPHLTPDITDLFRTPSIGLSAAWYEGNSALSKALVVSRLDGQAAEVRVPQGCSLDYIGYLAQPGSNRIFLLSWDMEVKAVNGGGGMFFVRFETYPASMQVLFGFLDDGRLVRFPGQPSFDTLVEVGTFQGGTRYRVYLIWDLVSKSYSVFFDGVWVVDHEPIPSHFDVYAIQKFGFDVNQWMGLPGNPAQGNIYYVDNIKFGPLKEKPTGLPWMPLILGN